MTVTTAALAEDLRGPETSSTMEPHDPKLFFNRELSWLAFNERVLEEASEPGLPLYERLKFLGICSSNPDEFFIVRVAGLEQQLAGGVADTAPG